MFAGIECGDVGGPVSEHMKVLIISREVGGRAVFSCHLGYGIHGPTETVCQPNGEWATPIPTCEGLSADKKDKLIKSMHENIRRP